MTILQTLLNALALERLGWTLLHFLWQGAAVALLLAMVLAFLRRHQPQWRYLAASGSLVLLLCLPVATFFRSAAGPSGNLLPSSPVASVESPRPLPALPVTLAEPGTSALSVVLPIAAPAGAAHLPLHPPAMRVTQRITQTFATAIPWLVPLWALGVLALSLWNLTALISVQRLKFRATQSAPQALQDLAVILASRLRIFRPVRLLQSTLADAPMVIGFFKPVILFPVSLLTDLPQSQLEALLAHELAHIRRHDYLVNLLQTVIETLLFYHPAVWWVSRRIRIEREHCCDDLAVAITRDRATYIRALAAVVDTRAPILAPAASGGGGGVLLPRLHRLLGHPNQEAFLSARWLAGAVGMLFVVWASLVTTIGSTAAAAAPAATPASTPPPRPIGYLDPAYAQAKVHEFTLTGIVVDAADKPVSGAKVYLGSEVLRTSRADRIGPEFVATDAQGRFSFDYLLAGRTDVWAETATAVGWTRDLDSNAKGIVIRLNPKTDPITMAGTLFDSDGQTPVNNARIVVINEVVDKPLAETSTDQLGHYQIQVKPGYEVLRYMRLLALPPAPRERPIAWCVLPYCSGTRVDLQLKPKAVLVGRVMNKAGAALPGATVMLGQVTDPQYGNLEGRDTTVSVLPTATADNDGWFVLHGIPQGATIGVVAQHSDYQSEHGEQITLNAANQEILAIRLAIGATLEGTIFLAPGKPAEGATVTLGYPVSPPQTATTDKAGHYRLSGLKDGSGGSQLLIEAKSGGTPPEWEASTYYEKPIKSGDHVTVDLTLARSLSSLQAEWKQKPGIARASKFNVAILSDADPAFVGKATYDDTLTLRDSGGKSLWQKSGINGCENIGGGHPVAADLQRKTLWVCESAGDRLLKYDPDGTLAFEKADVKPASVAIDPKTGNAWVLTSAGIIYGDKLLVFSPDGRQLHQWDVGGYDIVYSAHDDCFWTVGKNFKKIDRDGKVLLTSAQDFAWVAMSISINESDGSVWIAEGRHSNVINSRGQVSIVAPDGQIRKKFSVDLDNRCVVVDAPRQVAWIAGHTRLYKLNLEGIVLAEIPLAFGSTCAIEPDTGYLWWGSYNHGVWRLDTDGNACWNVDSDHQNWICLVPQ